jgi:cell fate regulator YaaT (PSP1 superfamily)
MQDMGKIDRFDDKDFSQGENLEQYLDLDIRSATTEEAKKISGNSFHTRGLNAPPEIDDHHCKRYNSNCCKLATHDWIDALDMSPSYKEFPVCEVRFKNSHKDFFILPEEGVFQVGDIVAVEALTGHDIGIVSLIGLSVKKQLTKKKIKQEEVTKKLYRQARVADIDKWIATVDLENRTMLSSRYIAWDLNLNMKVNDVEYQGDGTKAIFYYSAEDRVDFRELIKILAEQFKIRIEMRQIGVRQEAARLGGLGTCGRELCCASWLTGFQSVSTITARTKQLTLNPQKLAGMCGKLKCCLNFEQETYLEELKAFPQPNTHLLTKKGKGFYNKIDIMKKVVWYHYADDNSTIFAIPLDKVNQIIEMNKNGKRPETLEEFAVVNQNKIDEGVHYSLDELKNIEDR